MHKEFHHPNQSQRSLPLSLIHLVLPVRQFFFPGLYASSNVLWSLEFGVAVFYEFLLINFVGDELMQGQTLTS